MRPMGIPKKLERFARLLILGNLAILAVLTLTVVMALQASRQTYVQRAQETAENLAYTLSLGISAEIRQIDNALLSTSEQLSMMEDTGKVAPDVMLSVAARHRDRVPQVDAVRVADLGGLVRTEDPAVNNSIADRDYFQQALKTPGQLVVSEPVKGRITQKWGVVLARARMATNGQLRGVIYANLSSNHLVDRFDDFSLGSQGAIALRSDSNQLIARYSAMDRGSSIGLGTSNISEDFKKALAANPNKGFFITRTVLDGVERASAYQRVPGFPMVVTVGLGTADFYAPWSGQAQQMIFLGGVLALMVVSASLMFYRRQAIQLHAQEEIASLASERGAMLQSGLVGMSKLKDRIVLWNNQAVTAIYGYGPTELVGHNSRVLYPDDATYMHVGKAYSQLDVGGQYRTQVQMVRKDGKIIWVDLSGSSLGNGESLWMMVDITAVKESEYRHRAIVEEQSELVSLARQDGTLLYVNPAYARHFRTEPSTFVGKNLFDFVEPADRAAVRAQVDAVFESGQMAESENRMVEPDGSEVWIAWSNSIQIGADGERLLHSVGRDVTRRTLAEKALNASQDFLVRTGHLAGVGGWEVDLVAGVIQWSDEVCHIHDMPPGHVPSMEEAVGYYLPEDHAPLQEAMRLAMEERKPFDMELTMITATGRRIAVRTVGECEFDEQGKPVRMAGALQDITARKALEATLRAVVETIPAMVAVLDRDLRFLMVNRAFERWREKDRGSINGKTMLEVLGQAEFERSLPWAQRALAGETVSYEKDYPGATHNRHVSLSYVPLRLDDGSINGMISVAQDITLHRSEQARLLDLSERDTLTGLLNRAGFTRFLTSECETGGANNLALLYIDLDRFKPVNDSYGHAVGDEVLQQFAHRLLKLVRPTDAVARLGGDEFSIVLTNVRQHSNADAVADKVVEAAQAPFAVGELAILIGASVGVAFGADGPHGWKGLVERADAKVYAAKAAGRGRRA